MVDKLTTYNDEMLSIYFRYVDQNKEIREILLEFPEAEWVSNQEYIFHFFFEWKEVDIKNYRSQCYNGAPNTQ